MKIIQIIVKKDRVYGLCDKGQVWELAGDIDCPDNMWVLVVISSFVRSVYSPLEIVQNNGSLAVVQDNELKINLTKE